ncbi:uncharacterized protein A4U43_C04F17270 [Asparagus officinalis]|uniref:Uncharacterized protein n=1 Tax=Asparagus officinalis TaxID=4686 RepID=A0A5P1F496_ASPOF|nr:uncharacterized protein A4U43_C04F17270 [Asparagus officinalis]
MGSGVSRHLLGCLRSSADGTGENKHAGLRGEGRWMKTLATLLLLRSVLHLAGPPGRTATGRGKKGNRRGSSCRARRRKRASRRSAGASVSGQLVGDRPIYDKCQNPFLHSARSHCPSSSSFSRDPPSKLGARAREGGGAAPPGRAWTSVILPCRPKIERGALSGRLDSRRQSFLGACW